MWEVLGSSPNGDKKLPKKKNLLFNDVNSLSLSLSIKHILLFICNFLTGAVLLLKSVDYGRMAEILVQRAASPDEFTRLTAITWVRGLVYKITRA